MKAVIFDMDGVILVDTEDLWHEQERALFRDIIDGDVDPQEIIDAFTGMYFKEIYANVAEQYPVTVSEDEFVERFHAAAETVYAGATLMDGFHDIVSDLQDRGVQVAVATSSPQRWVDIADDRFDLRDTVSFVISAEDIDAPGKPDPAIYRAAADRLGVAPADCVAVEDSVNGVTAAVAAGMYTIAFRPGREEARDRADTAVDGPADLRRVLQDR